MSQTQEVEALIAKLKTFTDAPPQNIDNSTRIKLREASKNLSIAVEIHGDTVHRIGNSVCSNGVARGGARLMIAGYAAVHGQGRLQQSAVEGTGGEREFLEPLPDRREDRI
jgi:hypothetical protein